MPRPFFLCPDQTLITTPTGTCVGFLIGQRDWTSVSYGTTTCGPWSAWGPWTKCSWGLSVRYRDRSCSRVVTYQDMTTCTYMCSFVLPPVTAEAVYKVGPPRQVTETWKEEDYGYSFCLFSTALKETLKEESRLEPYTHIVGGGEDSLVVMALGSDFNIYPIPADVAKKIKSQTHTLDGKRVELPLTIGLNEPGKHVFESVIVTKKNKKITLVLPYAVKPPVSLEATPMLAPSGGSGAFTIHFIARNETDHAVALGLGTEDGQRVRSAIVANQALILEPRSSRVIPVSVSVDIGAADTFKELAKRDIAITLRAIHRNDVQGTFSLPLGDQSARYILSCGAASGFPKGDKEFGECGQCSVAAGRSHQEKEKSGK